MKVFVYGTLLRGMCRANFLAESQFEGLGVIQATLFDLGAYPAIQRGNHRVIGEVYSIDNTLLRLLDSIEGYLPDDSSNSLYMRESVKVTLLSDGSIIDALTYRYNQTIDVENHTIIPNGDYRRYLLEKSRQEQWYIAYGSNVNSERLKQRIGTIKKSIFGYLEDYELVFNKLGNNGSVYANLAFRGLGYKCPFVAYLLAPAQFKILDMYEGVPDDYLRVGMPFYNELTNTYSLGFIYIANFQQLMSEGIPEQNYVQHIYKGYREHGFSTLNLPQ